MTRGSQPAGSPGQSCTGTCSGLSGFQQVPPCSLVKLGSKATRQERWPPLGVIQSFPAPQHLPGSPQSLQVGGPCSKRAPAQIHQDPQDTCCHLHADLLRAGLDGGPGHGLPRGSHLHLLWGCRGGLSKCFESSSDCGTCDPLWPLLGPVLMALSLPAGTGKVPYQFTTLGQATTEFSKPLDGSGLFKNNPGTHLFCITPLFSPTAGQLGHPTGLSATSSVSWPLPSPQRPLAEYACPPRPILAYSPRIIPAAQAGLLDHTLPHPHPHLSHGWPGVFFLGTEK